MKSLHVLGTVQIGAPTTPVVFSTSVSVYVMGGLVGVSVPLAGVGALGTTGAAEDGEDVAGCFVFAICKDGALPANASMAREKPDTERRTTNALRLVIKPDVEEECFFIRTVPGALMAQTQALGAARRRHLSQRIVFCLASIFCR